MLRFSHEDIGNDILSYVEHANHPLEPDQEPVLIEIARDVLAGRNSGHIRSPGGTGKTVMFGGIFTALKQRIMSNIGADMDGALLVVDTTNAALQAKTTLTTKLRRDGSEKPLYGWSENEVKIFDGDSTEAEKQDALKAPLVIMTLAGFYARQNAGWKIRERRPIGNIDEIDAQKGDNYGPFIRKYTESAFAWGWSATDTYVSPAGLVNIAPSLFGRPTAIHTTTLRQAAERKQITPIRNIVFVANLESGIERKLRGIEREYTPQESRAIVARPGRDDAVIRSIVNFVDPETGIAFKDLNPVYYCEGTDHADRIAARLNAIFAENLPDGSPRYPYGYAVAISGKTKKKDWVDEKGKPQFGLPNLIELHRQGVIPALTNADIAIRSLDSERTELAVMVRGSRSPTLIEQAGSRVDRPNRDNPNKLGYVASFVDRDMAGALVFSDVSGDPRLGMVEGQRYATHNQPRNVNLDMLNPAGSTEVEVQTLWEPRDITQFFTDRTATKQALAASLAPIKPEGLLTYSEFAVSSGISYATVEAFFNAVKSVRTGIPDDVERSFQVGRFTLSTSEAGSFRPSNASLLVRFYVHEKHAPQLKVFDKEARKWGQPTFRANFFLTDPDWFSASELDDISSSGSSYDFQQNFKRMVEAEGDLRRDPFYTDRVWRITQQPRGKNSPLCLHKSNVLAYLRAYHGATLKRSDDWSNA